MSNTEKSSKTSDVIAVVALVISITSFIVAVAQALQQYLSSADGYRRCSQSVMGGWARLTRRNFRWDEVRFDTVFETPVFFLAPPENKKGPVSKGQIHNVDGTQESYLDTLTVDPAVPEVKRKGSFHGQPKVQAIHTAENELATWVTLLSKLQELEQMSRYWDKEHSVTPKGKLYEPVEYSLCVQLQSKRHNWDYMPSSVLKPFATTTISHVAELARFLGMIWKAFDVDSGNLRAEGNGLVLTSSQVQGLGLTVELSVTGRSEFSSNRLIPCSDVKKLAFGTVPTIISNLDLKLGEEQDIRRTLKSLKCRQDTISKISQHRDHVRSMSYELIAMIGQVFRLRGSNFKIIPNPTSDSWTKNFSACDLMRDFHRALTDLIDSESDPSVQILAIKSSCEVLSGEVWREPEAEINIDMREAVHSALDSCTTFLHGCGQETVLSVVGAHVTTELDQMERLDSFLITQDRDNDTEIFDHYFNKIRPRVVRSGLGRNNADGTDSTLSEEKMLLRQDIWITLQFRMSCWWLLHDFEENDAMILPPRLMDSRLPVFIL